MENDQKQYIMNKDWEFVFKFAVDIPDINDFGDMVNIDYFETKEEAIAFCKEKFGADDEGKICLLSQIHK